MTAFNENNLNNQDENLSTIRQNDNSNTDQLVESRGISALKNQNPFTKPENPMDNGRVNTASATEQLDNEEFGENAGIFNTNVVNNESVSPGPDDDDLSDEDDLDFDDDDDDDSLIPIADDDDEDSLDTDGEDDIVPGTDMDDDDIIDDDEDNMDEDTSVNRSTTSGMGSNVSTRDMGRNTGRMINHEPGTNEI